MSNKRDPATGPMAKPDRSLVEHTDDVVAAFAEIFGREDSLSDLARKWLRFFKLTDADLDEFLQTALFACMVHDWGKANAGFEAMLFKRGKQAVRHEVVSTLILMRPEVWGWLQAAERVDPMVVLGVVAGHHLKAADSSGNDGAPKFGATQVGAADVHFELTWNHPAIREHLEELARVFGLSGFPRVNIPETWVGKKPKVGQVDYIKERKRVWDRLDDMFIEVNREPDGRRARMLRAVRSALIAANSAGSGLFRTHGEEKRSDEVREHIRHWLGEAFSPAALMDAAKIEEAVIKPRLDELARWGRPIDWNEFQEACAEPAKVPPRALLIAPCGSGKTLAA